MKKLICIILIALTCLSLSIPAHGTSAGEYKIGDTDLDDRITIVDATYIQFYISELLEFTAQQLSAADTDFNDSITIIDATTIQRYLAEIITEFAPSTYDQPTPTQVPTQEPTVDDDTLELSQKIKKYQSDDTLTLSLMADTHYDKAVPFDTKKLAAINTMGDLQTVTDIDLVANLGDIINGNTEKSYTIINMKELIEATHNACDSDVFFVRGNHDDNGWYSQGGYGGTYKKDEIINDKEWYDIALKDRSDNFVMDESNPYGGYGYYDHEDSKIRVFMLNSCDIPYILDDDSIYRYSSYLGHGFSDAQLDFVAKALLFEDKEDPSQWAALFLSHVPLDTSNLEGERFGGMSALIRGHEYMLSIISAYRKGTSFKASGNTYLPMTSKDNKDDFNVSVDIDYSKKGCGEVIAFISGHTHSDNYCNTVGVKNSLSYGYTFLGLVGINSFSNFVIDRDNHTISVVKYGRVIPETAVGTLIGTPDYGTIESGDWTVSYSQFLPNGENIYTGASDIYPIGHTFDNSSGIDLETLELEGVTQTKASRQLTKAIPIKPLTTYAIPSDFKGDCYVYSALGKKSSALRITEQDGYKTFTTNIRNHYVVFSLDTGFYKDYENFFIKEIQSGLTY